MRTVMKLHLTKRWMLFLCLCMSLLLVAGCSKEKEPAEATKSGSQKVEIENEETGENKYFIIHYNSWKYDYYEEPLVAIVSSIVSSLDENKIIKNPKTRIVVKEVFKEIGMALLDLANASVKKITGIDVKDKISSALESAKKIKKKSKKKIKEANKYDGYFDLKNLLGQLKKSLNQLSEEYTIVFIVDGIINVSNEVHPENACSSIVVIDDGNVNFFNEVHPLNVYAVITTYDEGRVILDN